jgi:hypothetical protein
MSYQDFDVASRLHRKIALGLGPEIFVPTTDEELEWLLTGKGMSVGVWQEGKLICMRAVRTDAKWVEHSVEEMGLKPDGKKRIAITDHCIVDKEYRGNNIQFLTNYELEGLIAVQFDELATTVAPMNVFSLQNVINCGFHITGLGLQYEGYLRYTLVKKFRSDASIWMNWHHAIPIRDIERQKQIISAGCVGYKLKRTHNGFTVLYAPVDILPPPSCQRRS